jgi:hypothetical protein
MFSDYFDEWKVRPEFSKEYVSLWDAWLGRENYHKLDAVTESDWARFNILLRGISRKFSLELANCDERTLTPVTDIETVLANCQESMNKDSSKFIKLVIPELKCIVTEEWDYTYIIWHKNNGAVESLIPLIKDSALEHFHD